VASAYSSDFSELWNRLVGVSGSVSKRTRLVEPPVRGGVSSCSFATSSVGGGVFRRSILVDILHEVLYFDIGKASAEQLEEMGALLEAGRGSRGQRSVIYRGVCEGEASLIARPSNPAS
jgi:hypothetical protein